uniref:Uncharacterized protein n=1 Tax=Cacopsylla melanoneura TaxID=428564 RepID=A0A8D8PPJ2_9HEMI
MATHFPDEAEWAPLYVTAGNRTRAPHIQGECSDYCIMAVMGSRHVCFYFIYKMKISTRIFRLKLTLLTPFTYELLREKNIDFSLGSKNPRIVQEPKNYS